MEREDLLTASLFVTAIGYYPHAGHHYCRRDEGCGDHVLIYCVDGSGWYRLGGRTCEVSAGDYFIHPAGCPHAYGSSEGGRWTIYWIHFNGMSAGVYAEGAEEPQRINTTRHSRMRDRNNIFEEILATLSRGYSLEHLRYASALLHHYLASMRYLELYRSSGVEGVDYTVLNDVFIVERSAVTKQFFVSDGDNNWIAINAGDYYGNMGSLKGGYYSGVFGGKNLNPYLNMSSTPFEGVDVDSVKPNEYSLAHNFTPKVDEVIIISKAYYKASDNALRAYAPGGVQGPSCTVDNTLYSYDFEDGKKYTVTGVINIKEPWATTGDKGLMDYDYAFQNYKLLVTDVIEEPIPTAINGIFLEEGVKSVRYYNAAGVESNVPFQGINIVVKEMNDGSRVTTKMVK